MNSHSDQTPDDPSSGPAEPAPQRPAPTVLDALQSRVDGPLGVHLESGEPEDRPLRVTDEVRAMRDPRGRYQIVGEVGRGGVGVVYKGRDQDLGRDVAMKFLKDEFAARPDVLARFVEEAQIGGQLQHPGIVPVYELGMEPGDQPYFAMKLVKGETLAAQLSGRTDPTQERRRLLGIFEQICQTMAYAHSRHVVHRDLKPANVMIGAFGEVQVVDWGFAKVLAKGGLSDEGASMEKIESQSVISTVRTSDGSGSQSIAGSVFGTPAYMPPEQARGDLDNLDARSDVFGIGAILCEILTGEPPYRHRDGNLLQQAAAAALEGAVERLGRCGADDAIVSLCIRCLSKSRLERPASAGALAERVSGYLTSVEERAHRAELDATRARYRQRTTFLGAAAAVVIMIVGGIAWSRLDARAREQQRAATRRAAAATSDAREAFGRARAAGDEPEPWAFALAEAERLVSLATGEDVDREMRAGAEDLLTSVRSEAGAAALRTARRARNKTMYERLTTLRIPTDDNVTAPAWAVFENRRLDLAYGAAFEAYLGEPLFSLGTEDVLAALRDGGMNEELAASLDHWALVRDSLAKAAGSALQLDPTGSATLRELAAFLDPGTPWRTELRSLLPNAAAERDRLCELAERAGEAELKAAHFRVLAMALRSAEAMGESIRVLELATERHPQDFDLAFSLAISLEMRADPDWVAVLAAHRVARALAPQRNEVLHRIGLVLKNLDRLEDSLRVFEMLASRDESSGHWAGHLAQALADVGRLEEAAAAYRRTLTLEKPLARSHYNLGITLSLMGRSEEAIESFRQAVIEEPGSGKAQYALGFELATVGAPEEAYEWFRRAIKLEPGAVQYRHGFGLALMRNDVLDEALAVFDGAIDCDPLFAPAYYNRGLVLGDKGRMDEADASLRAALGVWSKDEGARSMEWIKTVEGFLSNNADRRARSQVLLAIARGEGQAGSPLEWTTAARHAYQQGEWLLAARTYTRAFAAHGELLAQGTYAYDAACAAVLASQGQSAIELGKDELADLRERARDWLVGDLARRARMVESEPQRSGAQRRWVERWFRDGDLASVRDAEALGALPGDVAEPWRALWGSAAELLERWSD